MTRAIGVVMLLDWAAATHRGRFWLVGLGAAHVHGRIFRDVICGLIVVAFVDVFLIAGGAHLLSRPKNSN